MTTITYSKEALKSLKKIPANTAGQIRNKIKQYADNPASLSNQVKKLQGSPYYRLRVGKWRIIFDQNGNVLHILKIRPRGAAYR